MGADAFFLPAVLALGVVSIFQDFRVRRVSNQWIIISLVYAVLVHAYLFLSSDQQELMWFQHAVVNILVSAIVAVYFWKESWWGGGDAKLFICYAALIPLSHYRLGYFSYYFASFFLLIVIFVSATIWTFLHAQFNLIKAGKSVYHDFRPARLGEFFQLGAGFTALFFLSNLLTLIISQYCHWFRDLPLVIWILSMGFYKTVFRIFQKRLWLVIAAWALGICIIIFVPFLKEANMLRILTVSFVYWVLIFILRKHLFKTIDYYVEWKKNNSMAFAGWMFLGALIVWFSRIIP